MPARPPSRRRSRDGGSLHVLEAILIAFILMGGAYAVVAMRGPTVEPERPRQNLGRLAHDALVVLDGIEEERGTLLDLYLVEAMQCASVAPPSDGCDGRRSRNLSVKLDNYLPRGAGYGVALDNGVAPRDIYRSVLPAAETIAADLPYAPTWNLTFVLPELSCYEPGMDVNVTLAPLWRAAHAKQTAATSVRADYGASQVNATPGHSSGTWNATLPAATRPAAASVVANVTGHRDPFPGAAAYASCDLGGDGPALVAALRATPFSLSHVTAPLGARVSFEADVAALAATPDITVTGASITVYDPLPPHGSAPDTYTPAATLEIAPADLAAGVARAAWEIPESSLYGVHPVVLTFRLDTDGNSVEARRLGFVTVALPSGIVPIDPPYRAVLQAWFPEW